jgi:hypothetical protein
VQRSLPLPAWSLLQGPAGAAVDNAGRISGWTPTIDDLGRVFMFQVRAQSINGSDTESWQVRVKSRADLDGDGDVDQSDYAILQNCMSGTGEAYQSGCQAADLTGDDDVDQQDVDLFLDLMAGPGEFPRG